MPKNQLHVNKNTRNAIEDMGNLQMDVN